MGLSLNVATASAPAVGKSLPFLRLRSSMSQGEDPHLLRRPQSCTSECLLQASRFLPCASIFASPSLKFILGLILNLKKTLQSSKNILHTWLTTCQVLGIHTGQDSGAPKELTVQRRDKDGISRAVRSLSRCCREVQEGAAPLTSGLSYEG